MPTDSVLERLRALRCHGCETVPVEGCLWCVHVRNKVAAALRVVAKRCRLCEAQVPMAEYDDSMHRDGRDCPQWTTRLADALEKGE